ncbi:MAG: MotA/TolQ/ExbB proton channel family protein [Elusimicrobiota bacterium]
MDLMAVFGLLLGCASVYYVSVVGNITNLLFNLPSLVLVLGGTIGSTMITYPFSVIRRTPKVILTTLIHVKKNSLQQFIDRIFHLAEIAYARGIDVLPEQLNDEDDNFLKTGVQMLIEDWSEKDIEENLEREINFIIERHQQIQRLFISMSNYAPIYGLLGTLVGVLGVLQQFGDPVAMGKSMAVAIVTTFYGIFGANFIFSPLAGKIETYSEEEIVVKRILMIGVISIKKGNPVFVVKEKLERFLAHSALKISH